jgi:protoporphyrinogen oxidase
MPAHRLMPPRHTDRLRPGDRIVIAGAGPAGLTAAYLLAGAGHQVTVLEAGNQVGGLARTVEYKGFRFDIGGHRFFTQIPAVEALWEELLGDQMIDVPRLSRIRYDGKYFQYPLQVSDALRGLGATESALILLSYLGAQLWPAPVEENFEQWVSNRFGPRLYRTFFKTYTEKVWGIPCTEIRAEWAAQRIQGLSLMRALFSRTPLNLRPATIKTLISHFKYPRLGPGQMWEACRDRITERGGRVLLNHPMTRLEFEDGRVRAMWASSPEGEQRFEGDHFISTAPLRSLIRAAEGVAPQPVRKAAEELRSRDFLLVALILNREGLFPDNWLYIHTPRFKVGRVQNYNNWSPALVPMPNRTCLGMEYFCSRGDELWSRDDRELVDLASRELSDLGLALGASVVDAAVVRAQDAYPVYDSTYREHLHSLRLFLDPIANLHTVGRNGMHKYNNQDHSMYAAMLTVANLRGESHDVWEVNTDLEYHEAQKVCATNAARGPKPQPARGSLETQPHFPQPKPSLSA